QLTARHQDPPELAQHWQRRVDQMLNNFGENQPVEGSIRKGQGIMLQVCLAHIDSQAFPQRLARGRVQIDPHYAITCAHQQLRELAWVDAYLKYTRTARSL